VSLDEEQLGLISSYATLLKKWNKTFNLISRQDIGRLGPRHLLDSLAGAPLLRGDRVMDLGSGAGLPGIPLAIAAPDKVFTLCDRSSRRCRFLSQVVQTLPLSQVNVWQGDFGADADELGRFDTIVARGVATAFEVWAMVQGHLADGGCVLVYESTQIETDPEAVLEELPQQEGIKTSRHTYSIDSLHQTHSILCMERA